MRESEKAQRDALQSAIAMEFGYPLGAARCIAGGETFTQTGAPYIGQ